MPGPRQPALLRAGQFLDWYDDFYAELPYTVPASILAPGLPATDVHPRMLRRYLIASTDYAERDRAWRGIITLTRQPDTEVEYTLIGLGIALKPLRWYRYHLQLTSAADIADMDADLVHGFLQRLPTVDIDQPNIAGRLVSSAKGYARRRFARHVGRPQPVADTTSRRWQSRGNPDDALYRIAAQLSEAGPPFTAGDIELIGRTRIDRHTLIQAAAEAGLTVEAAYKRRQRAEARIATLYPYHATPTITAEPRAPHAATGDG